MESFLDRYVVGINGPVSDGIDVITIGIAIMSQIMAH